MNKQSSQGFHIVELIVIVVVIAVIGLISWRVFYPGTSNQQAATQTQIKSKADAEKASQSLNDTSLDTNLDPSQLDADISSVL